MKVMLEPDAVDLATPEDMAAMSQAISLKRIANSLAVISGSAHHTQHIDEIATYMGSINAQLFTIVSSMRKLDPLGLLGT